MIKRLYDKYKEYILYIIFGVLTTLVNWVIFTAMQEWLHADYQLSNVISWIGAVLFAYVVNKKYVFASKCVTAREAWLEFGKFVASRLSSLALEIVCMYLLIDLAHWNTYIAKAIVSVLVIIANYVLSKLAVFRKSA